MKNRSFRAFTFVAVALTSASPAFAGQAAPAASPKSPLDELKCLAGSWSGGGTYSDGKTTHKVTATWRCEEVSAGAGVRCQMSAKGIPGMASYEGTDLFGYDAADGMFHWYSVTNAGEVHDHVGKLEGNTLRVDYRSTVDGKPFHERIAVTMPDERTMTGSSETMVDGKTVGVLKLNLKK